MHIRTLAKALTLAASALLFTSPVQAALSLSIVDSLGDPSSVSLAPGETFTFTLSLDSTAESTVGLSFRLEAPGDGSGQFRITGRDTTGTAYSELTTGNEIALEPGSALLDAANDADLGGTVSGAPNGTGNSLVATFTVQALAGIPVGTYTIQTTDEAIATDDGFNDVPLSQTGYSVTVVPEPGTAAMLLVGCAAGILSRRRH